MVPAVARRVPVDRAAGAAHHDHALDAGNLAARQGLVHVRLERDALAAANAFVRRDDELRLAVADAPDQRLGREAAEHDGMDRADARAGEHRHRDLGNHRQVDRDPVAAPDAFGLQHVGEAAHALVQVAIGDRERFAGVVALPQDRGLVAARAQMPVEAVRADVELAVLEPADTQIIRVKARVLDLRVRADPVEPAPDIAPESFRLIARVPVGELVLAGRDARVLGELLRRRVDLAHGGFLPDVTCSGSSAPTRLPGSPS